MPDLQGVAPSIPLKHSFRLWFNPPVHATTLLLQQVVLLGSGAPDYEARLVQAQADFPYHVRGVVGFDVPLSHRLLAAGDVLLMPSRFEPCGLNQMHAMRYGCVPVAHCTGGLSDTIDDVSPFRECVGREV